MILYIKSEFYRLQRYKWTYLFIALCSLLLLSSNIVLAVLKYTDASFPYATTYFSFSNVTTSMVMVYVLCIVVSSMVFGNEHAGHTMKNSVSYGISRGKIYFGKLIVQMVYAIAAFTIIIGFHVISSYLLLEDSGIQQLKILLRACTAALPLFLFGLAASNCFTFNIEGSGAIAASSGLMIALPLVCNALGMKFHLFEELTKLLPWNILSYIGSDDKAGSLIFYWTDSVGYRNCWILGTVQTILIAFAGYLWFRKKEIK
ncbi:ABC transporter permease [Anaerocolumna sp. AGMB13025]|uniref:ABC transporter permease n=1 Tax=Anaerocolumna sp. AGMB13025 TaxID=3039116 RepID=UPI00241E26F4|nr:ABC transporter permease [Anaerocolumna sp. AGMB13025]WFR59887.1 ABC transporter permease [Anaerocolumna sp. AGMB13025]